MPTINYFYADVYPDQLEMPDFSVEISMEEWNRRIEQEHRWKSDGRMARREVSLFDMIHAEILGEHNAEKAKVRNRRKADRKAKRKSGAYVKRNGGDFRKDEHYAGDGRMWHDYVGWEHTKSQIGGKIREWSLRKDYDAEIRQHEDAMQEYADYCLMAEQHEERLEYLRNLTGNVEFWEIMINEISREKIYEENRIREMRNIANNIMKGECY